MGPTALVDLSLEDWSKVVDVGLTGTFLMTQAAGRWWIDKETPGAVVNLSSTGGLQPYNLAGACRRDHAVEAVRAGMGAA